MALNTNLLPDETHALKSRSEQENRVNVGPIERLGSVVAGGALATYGLAKRSPMGAVLAVVGGSLVYRGATGHCPAYGSAGINRAASYGTSTGRVGQVGFKVEKSVTINRSASDLFAFWRHLENLPRILSRVEKIEVLEEGRSRWTVTGPAGRSVSWEAEIVNEIPDETIAWRSLPGSDVTHAGSVRFKDLGEGRGTEMTVQMQYDPPAGFAGAAVASLLGEDPVTQLREDLRRFKQVMETGEVATVEGQPSGRVKIAAAKGGRS